MNPLSFIPVWVWAIALAAMTALAGLQTIRLAGEETDHAKTRGSYAEERTKAATVSRQAEVAARVEERRKTQAVQEIANETTKQLEVARATAADSQRAAGLLRLKLAATCAGPRGGPAQSAVAGAGQTTDPTVDLFERVQLRLDDAADRIAQFADESRIAGKACERSYEALTNR